MAVPQILIDPDNATLHRKVLNGRRDWIRWRGRDGVNRAAARSAPVIKEAMLAMGTEGRFTLYSGRSVISHAIGWRQALILLKNTRRGYV